MADLRQATLYGILDTGYTPRARWQETARALLEGGVGILQVRAKGAPPAEVEALAREVLPLCARAGVPLIVNDHIDVAARLTSAGAHVGQDDISPAEARAVLGPGRILGLSTHSPAQIAGALENARYLDYFAVGPVFATPTKPTYEPVGLDLVAHAASLSPPLPFFCIGGIKLHNVEQVLAAGARRVVVVSGLLLAEDPAKAARAFRRTIEAAEP